MEKTILLAVLSLLVHCASIHAQPTAAPLVQKNHLIYQGAFRVPTGSTDAVSFNYGGTALGYNPINNSLFLVGNVNYQLTAEISIPSVVNSTNINSLATATFLQALKDSTEGRLGQINPADSNPHLIGGNFVYNGKLIVTGYSYYDGSSTQVASHFSRPRSLATTGQVVGPYLVGADPHFTGGYMTLVPSEWQSLFGGPALTGMCCVAIASIQSSGPSISTFDPNLNAQSAVRLLGYPIANPLRPVSTGNLVYNLTSSISGVIFPNGTRSVLFFGRHGTGVYCYGIGGVGGECNDPADDTHGVHAYPYLYQVWAYDANDLLSVKNGTKQQYEPQPYAIWNFNLPFESDDTHFLGGAAYDPVTQRVYISQLRGDYPGPLIHVFKIKVGLPPPANLKVQ